MKLKHYIGALLMAGSVVGISFPADANPGIRFCQRFCQRSATPLVKSIEKTIIKPNINRAIGLIPRSQAEKITENITIVSKVLPSISTSDITSKLSQLASPSPVVASPPSVVPTQPTGSEQEALKQHIKSRYGIAVGGTIIVSSGTVVYLNSQNANSERTQIRVSGVRISPAAKSALISLGKEFVCDSLPVAGQFAVTVLQPDYCPATKETIFIRKRLNYQK